MIDRHLLGDVALAILLAVPTLPLSRPQPAVTDQTAASAPLVEQAALADRTSAERRFSRDG
ncbi:MAG: hypothetical protein ACJ8FL_05135 [Sphingomicrobium sp.]